MSTRLQGVAIVLYFTTLPYVVITRWHAASSQVHGLAIHVLLVVLVYSGSVFLFKCCSTFCDFAPDVASTAAVASGSRGWSLRSSRS